MTKKIAYKGFDKDFQCRGFQFQVGETYEHKGPIKVCESGFHACENPFDVWLYYGPFESRFAEVNLSGKQATHEDDSKIAAAKIEIKAELTLGEFIPKAVNWLINHCKIKKNKNIKSNDKDSARIGSSGYSARIGSSGDSARIGSSGYYARIGSSGYYARIGSSGYSAQIGSSGDSARIGSSGYYAQIGSSGYSARIGSSGDSARIGSSGDSAQIGSSGDSAQIGSSGYYTQIGSSGDSAQIGSSGDYAQIEASGKESVIASAGYNARVKAEEGTWISVAEFDDNGKCVGFATGCIGKDGLEPDTWYVAKDGKLVEDQ